MRKLLDAWMIILFILLVIGWWIFFIFFSWKPVEAATNPRFIPVLFRCSNYQSHCGAEAKRVRALYGYLCQVPNYKAKTCDKVWNPEDIDLIFAQGWSAYNPVVMIEEAEPVIDIVQTPKETRRTTSTPKHKRRWNR